MFASNKDSAEALDIKIVDFDGYMKGDLNI